MMCNVTSVTSPAVTSATEEQWQRLARSIAAPPSPCAHVNNVIDFCSDAEIVIFLANGLLVKSVSRLVHRTAVCLDPIAVDARYRTAAASVLDIRYSPHVEQFKAPLLQQLHCRRPHKTKGSTVLKRQREFALKVEHV